MPCCKTLDARYHISYRLFRFPVDVYELTMHPHELSVVLAPLNYVCAEKLECTRSSGVETFVEEVFDATLSRRVYGGCEGQDTHVLGGASGDEGQSDVVESVEQRGLAHGSLVILH
jgi:hypothetical protein